MRTEISVEQVIAAISKVTHVGNLIMQQHDRYSGKQKDVGIVNCDLTYYFFEDGTEPFYTYLEDDPQFATLTFFDPPRVWGDDVKKDHRICGVDDYMRIKLIEFVQDDHFRIKGSG